MARGLFRLWLVLSLVWVVVAGAMMWPTWQLPPSERVVHPAECNKRAPNDCLLSMLKAGAQGKLVVEKIPRSPSEQRQHVIDSIYVLVVFTLIPPAVLLLIGSAFLWAFRGFAPR